MKKIFVFLKQPIRLKLLIIEAFFITARFNRLIAGRPFKDIAHHLGEEGKKEDSFNQNDLGYILDVRKAIGMVSRHTPWESKCLVQAFTAKHFLNKRSIPSTVFLGVRKDETEGMKAHAWTKCGQKFVTGGKGHARFTVTAKFS